MECGRCYLQDLSCSIGSNNADRTPAVLSWGAGREGRGDRCIWSLQRVRGGSNKGNGLVDATRLEGVVAGGCLAAVGTRDGI